jgi:putative DNA modification/repair radical SAM protein
MFSESIINKVAVLGMSARYDASCSSSGSKRQNTAGSTGNGAFAGICHSWSDDGRCVSLLKILQSNACSYNCAYCINRASNPIERASLEPRELAAITMEFYRRNYIEGLFLSSGVCGNSHNAMERMVETLRILRKEERFNGYIHVKAIPGADTALVEKAGKLADRISVNIELPSQSSLALLAPQKKREAIITPMRYISERVQEAKENKRQHGRPTPFAPAGQSTQMIVGASPENDRQIMELAGAFYRHYGLKRVYYSAYVPVNKDERLPALSAPPLWREHRLYQGDWLLRYYGFSADELLRGGEGNFSPYFDPKTQWALANLHFFPVEVNKADYELLLRVPGIGVKSAKRIITARRVCYLNHDDLAKLGVVMKRACYFITTKGKYCGGYPMEADILAKVLRDRKAPQMFQPSLQMVLPI